MATKPYLPETDARFNAIEAVTSVAVKKNAITAVSAGFGLSGLPAADPHVINVLYTATGVLKVSGG